VAKIFSYRRESFRDIFCRVAGHAANVKPGSDIPPISRLARIRENIGAVLISAMLNVHSAEPLRATLPGQITRSLTLLENDVV